MPLSLPDYPPVAGQKAKASQVTGWLAAIIAKFAAGIFSADIASNAGITGVQLSSSPGTRITEGNLEDNAVNNRVLKADATSGRAAAAVKRNNIVNGEVLTEHLATGAALGNLAANSVPLGKLAIVVHTVAISRGTSVGGGAVESAVTLAPTSTFPKATYDLLAIYAKNVTNGVVVAHPDDSGTNWSGKIAVSVPGVSGPTVTGTLVYVFITRA